MNPYQKRQLISLIKDLKANIQEGCSCDYVMNALEQIEEGILYDPKKDLLQTLHYLDKNTQKLTQLFSTKTKYTSPPSDEELLASQIVGNVCTLQHILDKELGFKNVYKKCNT